MDIEYEQGVDVGSPRHGHNGYYAGDFSGRPLPTGLRRDIIALQRPRLVPLVPAARPRGLRGV